MIIRIDTSKTGRGTTFVSGDLSVETIERWRDEDLESDKVHLDKFLIKSIESGNYTIIDEEEYGKETKRVNSFWEHCIKLIERRKGA